MHSLSTDEVYNRADKAARDALADIACKQMATWVCDSTDTTREILARRICVAIDEALVDDRRERRLNDSVK